MINFVIRFRRVYVLVDARHGVKETDIEMMRMLQHHQLNFQIILTKSDLASAADVSSSVQSAMRVLMSRGMGKSCPFVHVISARDGVGVRPIMQEIVAAARVDWAQFSRPATVAAAVADLQQRTHDDAAADQLVTSAGRVIDNRDAPTPSSSSPQSRARARSRLASRR